MTVAAMTVEATLKAEAEAEPTMPLRHSRG